MHDHSAHDHSGHDRPDYETEIAGHRAEKDSFFRSSHHSPIPAEERATFAGLPYYPVNAALRFEGLQLQPYDGDAPAEFMIGTSDDNPRPARRLGSLSFVVEDQLRSLVAYALGAATGSLFVPFLDATSGSETYGAGRYLDIEPEHDGSYVLDFNAAYHPSCVYSPHFSCPVTPAENRLPDRIEAGERLDSSHAH
ncbi:MAG: DUF1684 domain-containing protein [Candidatus Aminicenantes bacterium]|nr:MAG: DUF1684 domain-containing protein [Candidatus Aminicenantes bacterium]